MAAHVLASVCTGPNRACRMAHKQGRSVHVIPERRQDGRALVMPTYHYRTSADGIEAIMDAEEAAPEVATDADLIEYRERNIPFFLPVGWVDPSRR
jgi:hypothetical protein